MLILFFTIVFIAELIVADKAISWLKQQDKFVCETNQQVIDVKPTITNGLYSAKKGVKLITSGAENITKFTLFTKRQGIIILTKILFAGILLVILRKKPDKKSLTVIDALFAFANLLKL